MMHECRMDSENIEETYSLTPMQQGMLFNSLYAPQSGVDIEQMLCALREDLDASALKQAWKQVVERHAVLRTSFGWDDQGEPVQHVRRHVELQWEERDWRGLSAQEKENRLEAYLHSDRKCGFNLTKAPLMRVALFRMGEADHKLIWTFHHSILDGRSHPIVLKEVFAFYEVNGQGQFLPLPSPPLYRDYIAWYHEQDSVGSKAYWQEELKGFAAPVPLPMDAGRGAGVNQRYEYGEKETRLSKTITSDLSSLAEGNQLTLNTFVQGAWALLLSRYTGEEDIVFGAARAGRYATVPGADEMVGNCINTLPVRVRIAADAALIPWLQVLRAQHIRVRDHEHTPLVRVQSWSQVPAGTALFESIIVFDNYHLDSALRAQGGSWKRRQFRLIEQTNYPLTLYGYAEPELLLKIVYDRQRFDEVTITRLLGNLRTLLEGMAANPNSQLSKLPLLTEAETDQLLVEWNDTGIDYPKDACIHSLFEAQVERTPDTVAVVFEDQQLTYRELNSRANQLAHALRRLKVEPETRVGIYMDRSLDMVISLLAILKAGGAYLPLDPTYPADRIAFMVTDSEAPVIVTQERLFSDLPPHKAQVVTVDTSWDSISSESEKNVESGATSDNLGYLIYTSGSTGKPKGVMLCHRNVVNFFTGMDKCIPHDPPGVWLAVTTLSFDISVLELLWTLCRGFKVVIYAGESRSGTTNSMGDEEECTIPALIKRHNVSHFQCTPSMASLLLVDPGTRAALSTVQTMLVGGEAFPAALATELKEMMPGEVINMYGPTETTVWSSTYPVGQEQRTIPIGRPIANTQLYILDGMMQPVPVGVTGELFVGGDGVARGYLNRPELTAERFVDDPFRGDPDARLYRTGDLARYRRDGNIEFLGRIDHQVKIRGHRIELGEIEAVLSQHPAVREAVVVAREDIAGHPAVVSAGGKCLVAYIIPDQQHGLCTRDFRDLLKKKLPKFMVPAYFVSLDAFPLTPNGKVNRRALPSPQLVRPDLGTEYIAPKSFTEKVLAEVWSQVLGIEEIGRTDNFFDLGGHSLSAVQVIVKIRATCGVELPLRTFLHSSTLAGLAERVDEKLSEQTKEANAPATLGHTPVGDAHA